MIVCVDGEEEMQEEGRLTGEEGRRMGWAGSGAEEEDPEITGTGIGLSGIVTVESGDGVGE